MKIECMDALRRLDDDGWGIFVPRRAELGEVAVWIVKRRSSAEEMTCSDEKEACMSYLDRNRCPLFDAEANLRRVVREVGKMDV